MPEAEDVLIEAAERVTAATRALWRRRAGPEDAAALRVLKSRRRLELWLHAVFGRSWPVCAVDPPSPPRWLAQRLGGLRPWERAPQAAASTDGSCLFLPRAWLAQDDGPGRDLALVAALHLGHRLVSGEGSATGSAPAERDVTWCREAARLDAALARSWPGLAPRIAALRRQALAERPRLDAAGAAEEAVEIEVRALLGAPSSERSAIPATRPAHGRARTTYRGVATVPHWGLPRAWTPPPRASNAVDASAPPPGRQRALPRSVRRRVLDPEERQGSGPFVLPFADPHHAVQDAAGLERPPDTGDVDLDTLAEELASQDELPVVPDGAPAREVLESEGAAPRSAPRPAAAASDTRAWRYPEWDARDRVYRRDAVTLRESPAPAGDPDWAERVRRERGALLRLLRRRFEALRPRIRRVARQLEGDDFDLDGWVDEWADRRAGRTPPGRVYSAARRRRRDVSVGLLVDASGSTDGWVSGSARVVDVAREAALCFCEALGALGDRHAVWAFSGRGAHGVRFWVAKSFGEGLGAAGAARIAGIAPDGCTRLGAALRHATASLAREPSSQRLLLLLSDGKPYDEDGYEGAHGIEDVSHAVAEARGAGVRVFCATIDRAGPSYLPRMFGPFGYTVVRDVGELPARLPELHRRLTA